VADVRAAKVINRPLCFSGVVDLCRKHETRSAKRCSRADRIAPPPTISRSCQPVTRMT